MSKENQNPNATTVKFDSPIEGDVQTLDAAMRQGLKEEVTKPESSIWDQSDITGVELADKAEIDTRKTVQRVQRRAKRSEAAEARQKARAARRSEIAGGLKRGATIAAVGGMATLGIVAGGEHLIEAGRSKADSDQVTNPTINNPDGVKTTPSGAVDHPTEPGVQWGEPQPESIEVTQTNDSTYNVQVNHPGE